MADVVGGVGDSDGSTLQGEGKDACREEMLVSE